MLRRFLVPYRWWPPPMSCGGIARRENYSNSRPSGGVPRDDGRASVSASGANLW